MTSRLPAEGVAASRPRLRRRRRLAAAVRGLAAEETRPAGTAGRLSALAASLRGKPAAPTASAPVLASLRAMAEARQEAAPGDADAAELVARIAAHTAIPADICVAVSAILLPLLRLETEDEGSAP